MSRNYPISATEHESSQFGTRITNLPTPSPPPPRRGITFKGFLRIIATLKSKVFRSHHWACVKAPRHNILGELRKSDCYGLPATSIVGPDRCANTANAILYPHNSDYLRKAYRTHHFPEAPGGGGLPSTI